MRSCRPLFIEQPGPAAGAGRQPRAAHPEGLASRSTTALLPTDDVNGVGQAALLCSLPRLPCERLTWAANSISGNGRPVHALFLIATMVSIPIAASTSTAFAGGGRCSLSLLPRS